MSRIVDFLISIGYDNVSPDYSVNILCPFHEETHPSCAVYPETDTMFCFTEHKVWDVVSAVRQYYNLTYRDAVKYCNKIFPESSSFYRRRNVRAGKIGGATIEDCKKLQSSILLRLYKIDDKQVRSKIRDIQNQLESFIVDKPDEVLINLIALSKKMDERIYG